jgi:hypothetical protein
MAPLSFPVVFPAISGSKPRLAACVVLGGASLLAPIVALAAPTNVYSAGHADVVILYNPAPANNFTIGIEVEGGSVNGVPGVEAFFPIEDVLISTRATFRRPDVPELALAFEPLGVPVGAEVFWLPQDNLDAAAQSSPFLGWSSEAGDGQLVGDRIHIELVSVSAPGSVAATFSLWEFGQVFPEFAMSSADGVNAQDLLTLPIGHEHLNLGFGPTSAAGVWSLGFVARAEVVGGGTVTQPFVMHIRTERRAQAVPFTGTLGMFGLGFGLVACVGVATRQRSRVPHRG